MIEPPNFWVYSKFTLLYWDLDYSSRPEVTSRSEAMQMMWDTLFPPQLYVYHAGENTEGTITKLNHSTGYNISITSVEPGYLRFGQTSYDSYSRGTALRFDKLYNVSMYTKLCVKYMIESNGGRNAVKLMVTLAQELYTTALDSAQIGIPRPGSTESYIIPSDNGGIATYDISAAESGYVTIQLQAQNCSNCVIRITDIWFEE